MLWIEEVKGFVWILFLGVAFFPASNGGNQGFEMFFLTSSLKKPQYYNWLINNIL